MTTNTEQKPTCKVHGMVAPNAMCGSILVGLKYCGFRGDCEHKSTAEMLISLVKQLPKEPSA